MASEYPTLSPLFKCHMTKITIFFKVNTGNYGSEFKWHKPDIVPGIQMVEPFQYPTLESLVFKSFLFSDVRFWMTT